MIFLACFIRPGSWSVAICEDSIFLPSDNLAFMSFDIMDGDIFGVPCFYRCIFAPESAISSVYLPGELVGIPILFNKLIFGLLILIFFNCP